MYDRLHDLIDGTTPRSSATPEEQRQLAETEAAIAGVLRGIPAEPLPDLAPAVLKELEGLSPAWAGEPARTFDWRRRLRWLWTPQRVSLVFRPAYGLAFSVLLLLGVVIADVNRTVAPVTSRQVFVQFRLDAPEASRVALAGNFTNWKPALQLTRSAGGVWTIVVPLQEGVHNYVFVVDGNVWQPDPLAPAVSDGFGGQNSQIAVLSPDPVTKS